MSVIFKCQKSFRYNQILYQKTKNKDDNDTECANEHIQENGNLFNG
jgi:hypothetical protein